MSRKNQATIKIRKADLAELKRIVRFITNNGWRVLPRRTVKHLRGFSCVTITAVVHLALVDLRKSIRRNTRGASHE